MLWVTTPSGRKWSLIYPQASDVDIHDIAQNLSLQVRFNGSCGPYTTAEHSVHCHDEAVRRKLPADWCLMILLHDAHEAYIGDIVTPMTNALGCILVDMGYTNDDAAAKTALNRIRNRSDQAIFLALGVPNNLPGEAYHQLREIDAAAMMTERDALQPNQPEAWGAYENLTRLSFQPACWSADVAKDQFLQRLNSYKNRISHPAA